MIPVLIDFNKSCPINHGRKYNLTEPSKQEYRSVCRHIAPEVVDGTNCQSIYSDIYSYAYMVKQTFNFGYSSPKFKRILKDCLWPPWHLRSSLLKICSVLNDDSL